MDFDARANSQQFTVWSEGKSFASIQPEPSMAIVPLVPGRCRLSVVDLFAQSAALSDS